MYVGSHQASGTRKVTSSTAEDLAGSCVLLTATLTTAYSRPSARPILGASRPIAAVVTSSSPRTAPQSSINVVPPSTATAGACHLQNDVPEPDTQRGPSTRVFERSFSEIDSGEPIIVGCRTIVEALKNDVGVERESPKELMVNNGSYLDVLSGRDMDSFINFYSLWFFERFKINTDFSKLSVESRDSDPDFLDGLEVRRRLRVVNDTAGRATELTEEYINRTKVKDLKQALLLTILHYKRTYRDANKRTIVERNK
ncbi:hypothetical protein QAD02_003791 [Eretmocerus hayati]|uniref:Uncharacterized protein n=1 Tax=Eretmocerus hayati TaxID=131215 RepID=A0ACC2NN64_9HYME|nr:hypothetical protein QAD02_003791 [Eretmocerus hayati]